MRTKEKLQYCRDEIGHTDDEALCSRIEKLIGGDERYRRCVECALDNIEEEIRVRGYNQNQ